MADRARAHRHVPVPPYRPIYVVDGVHHKNCRLCDQPLLKRDGSPDLRRNWHPDCAQAYLAATPQHIRRIVYERDHGVCAKCGAFGLDWEADHIVPLIDGGSFDLANVQTLCHDCHAAKTAEENVARMRERRRANPPPAPLLELMADG